ncbi:hypothetical protein DPMN_032328, partial [Dreissena polymorpha]
MTEVFANITLQRNAMSKACYITPATFSNSQELMAAMNVPATTAAKPEAEDECPSIPKAKVKKAVPIVSLEAYSEQNVVKKRNSMLHENHGTCGFMQECVERPEAEDECPSIPKAKVKKAVP